MKFEDEKSFYMFKLIHFEKMSKNVPNFPITGRPSLKMFPGGIQRKVQSSQGTNPGRLSKTPVIPPVFQKSNILLLVGVFIWDIGNL